MKKFLNYFWQQIKFFLINPFWLSLWSIGLILIILLLNGWVWFLWIKKYQDLIGLMPISYAAAVGALNIFLANLAYRKESLVSFILLGAAILIQIIYLIFLKFFAMSQAF